MFGTGSVIREWARLCDLALRLLACQRETGHVREMEGCKTIVSLSKMSREVKFLRDWADRRWSWSVGHTAFLVLTITCTDLSQISCIWWVVHQYTIQCFQLPQSVHVPCYYLSCFSPLYCLQEQTSQNQLFNTSDIVQKMNEMKRCCFSQYQHVTFF